MLPAQRVEIRSATCPVNTTMANAVEVDLSFNAGKVVRIEIVVPAGHAGVTGLALAQAHGIVIPASGNTWIITDDEKIYWDVEDFLNNGSWQAKVYNLDALNPHSWYFRFLVRENSKGDVVAPIVPVTPEAIEAAAPDVIDQGTVVE